MGGFFPFTLTPEIYGLNGNPALTNDPFNVLNPNSGARMPLGTPAYLQVTAALATQFGFPSSVVGSRLKFRYVRLNSTTPPALVAGGPLFWKDTTFTIVTANPSEGMNGSNGPAFPAGILLNGNATNGNYIWMQTYGYNATVQMPTNTDTGASIIPASGTVQATYKITYGTAPSQVPLAIAIGPSINGSGPGLIVLEEGYGM